jgi:uncharacterized Zn finger protein
MSYRGSFQWKPYVRVADRQRNAKREMEKLKKLGHPVSPVTINGRAITKTFWGKSWCDNLEHYSDFENRLPRGRTYVRNGSVVDLQVAAGEVTARVCGSDLYRVAVKVASLPKAHWSSICADCAGAIDSLVELLQGRFSEAVMARLCQQKSGLFPAPAEIEFSCSCPDWASMCKHVAAVLYGIGARLDEKPELLFKLRQVDEKALVAHAGKGYPLTMSGPKTDKLLVEDSLSELFGIDLGDPPETKQPTATRKPRTQKQVVHRGQTPSPAPTKPVLRHTEKVTKKKTSKAKSKGETRTTTSTTTATRKTRANNALKPESTTKTQSSKARPKAKPSDRNTAEKDVRRPAIAARR